MAGSSPVAAFIKAVNFDLWPAPPPCVLYWSSSWIPSVSAILYLARFCSSFICERPFIAWSLVANTCKHANNRNMEEDRSDYNNRNAKGYGDVCSSDRDAWSQSGSSTQMPLKRKWHPAKFWYSTLPFSASVSPCTHKTLLCSRPANVN